MTSLDERFAWLADRRDHYAAKERTAEDKAAADVWRHHRVNAERVLARLRSQQGREAACSQQDDPSRAEG